MCVYVLGGVLYGPEKLKTEREEGVGDWRQILNVVSSVMLSVLQDSLDKLRLNSISFLATTTETYPLVLRVHVEV